jgi:cell wall-associated NlpC family hydrolase
LNTVRVPQQYQQAVNQAGAMCSTVSPPLIAAQLDQESGWNPDAVSPAGAIGIAQFMPDTARGLGINPSDPIASILGMGKYDCQMHTQVALVPGDAVRNMLAAYNAGPAAVQAARGVPAIPETQNYVRTIIAKEAEYSAPGASATPSAVVSFAEQYLGVPYVWGGTDPSGWDCSGFVGWVYAHFGYQLPRTSEAQMSWVTPTSNPVAGDLVFFGNGYHVGIYVGGGKMVDAPNSQSVTRVEDVWPDVSLYGKVHH